MESHQEQRLVHAMPEPGSPAPLPGAREPPGQEGPHPEAGGPAPSTALAPRRKRGGEAPQAGGGGAGKKYQRHAKPPYSFLALIALVIQGSPEKRLRLAEIIREIGRLFTFEERYHGWKESIRHNLSSNPCFFQELKDPTNPKTKGNFWRVNLDLIPPGALKLQNTPLSRQNGGALAPDLAPFVLGGRPYAPLQPVLPSAHRGAERPRSFTIESLLQRSPKADPGGPPPPNAVETPGQALPVASSSPQPEGCWLDPLRAAGPPLSLWAPTPNPLGCWLPPTAPWGLPPPASFWGALPSCVLVPPCPFLAACPLVPPASLPASSAFCPAACLPPACCAPPAAFQGPLHPPGCPAAQQSTWHPGPPLGRPASGPQSPFSSYPEVPRGHPS